MKKKIVTIALLFSILLASHAFADGVLKFEQAFWYTNGNGHWTFFVQDKYGAMDYLRNIRVGINEPDNFVYTIYYFDAYGHCSRVYDDIMPRVYINCYQGSIYDYGMSLSRDGYVIPNSTPGMTNIQ